MRELGIPARRLKAAPATAPIARPAITGTLPPLPLAAAPRTATPPAIAPRTAAPAPATAPAADGKVVLLPTEEPTTIDWSMDGRALVTANRTMATPTTM